MSQLPELAPRPPLSGVLDRAAVRRVWAEHSHAKRALEHAGPQQRPPAASGDASTDGGASAKRQARGDGDGGRSSRAGAASGSQGGPGGAYGYAAICGVTSKDFLRRLEAILEDHAPRVRARQSRANASVAAAAAAAAGAAAAAAGGGTLVD